MSDTHDRVRDHYRAAATGKAPVASDDDRWGAARYDDQALSDAPTAAAELSMGCGNPFALADLREGEVVLDLGSGAGLDVILSARRVGPSGRAYGVDFLDEIRELANRNAAQAGVDNVEFLAGNIEAVPLPDESVDVVISNCVITLAPDKAPVFSEMARVLRPGGRIAVSDVVTDEHALEIDPSDESWADCGAGGLDVATYSAMLAEAGFTDISVAFTHEVGEGMHTAAITASRPHDPLG